MNVWKIGSGWDSNGAAEATILNLFKELRFVFAYTNDSKIKERVKRGDLVAIAYGTTVVAIGRAIKDPCPIILFNEDRLALYDDGNDVHGFEIDWNELLPEERFHYTRSIFHQVQGEYISKVIELYKRHSHVSFLDGHYRIDKLELSNFKKYESLDIPFNPCINLLVGLNGSGKTTLLEALCVALGGFFSNREFKMQRYIKLEEIRMTGFDAETGKIRREPKASVTACWNQHNILWKRTINRDTKRNENKDLFWAGNYGDIFLEGFEKNNGDRTLVAPLIAYYSIYRLSKDNNQSKNLKYDSAMGRQNGYLRCLDEKGIKQTLSEWLGNAASRRATFKLKEIEKKELDLENVEAAIKKTMIRFLKLPNDVSLKIFPEPDEDNELYIGYDEHIMPLSYYADGFRNILFLVMDLVWRASKLNPWLDMEGLKEHTHGVVLIDEIDLHLHPRWQADVLPLLKDLFPNVQFFITTHSPTVVGNFKPRENLDGLFILDDNKVRSYNEKYFGKETNEALRDVLGASDRNIEIQRKLDKFLNLASDNASDYQDLLEELKDILGEYDADIQKVMAIIDRNKYTKENTDAVHS